MTFSKRAMVSVALLWGACGGSGGEDEVKSRAQAEKAWKGLDGIVEQSIDLGFRGIGMTNGANILPQSTAGQKSGTLTVVGKVDQGTSNNKNMDLSVGLTGFSNDGEVTYATPADPAVQPKLTLSLKKIPTGTLGGTFIGSFDMTGALKGGVKLSLVLDGALAPDPADPNKVIRKPGTTHIVGTAESMYGTYTIDLMR